MFSVVRNGEVIGLCDKPRYVKSRNGVYVEALELCATHVAIGGTAYPLTEAHVVKVDGGEYAFKESARLDETRESVGDTQDAVCEASADIESRVADIEDALCELSEQ